MRFFAKTVKNRIFYFSKYCKKQKNDVKLNYKKHHFCQKGENYEIWFSKMWVFFAKNQSL